MVSVVSRSKRNCFGFVPESQDEREAAIAAASDKFCGLTFGGVRASGVCCDVACHMFLRTHSIEIYVRNKRINKRELIDTARL